MFDTILSCSSGRFGDGTTTTTGVLVDQGDRAVLQLAGREPSAWM